MKYPFMLIDSPSQLDAPEEILDFIKEMKSYPDQSHPQIRDAIKHAKIALRLSRELREIS